MNMKAGNAEGLPLLGPPRFLLTDFVIDPRIDRPPSAAIVGDELGVRRLHGMTPLFLA